MKLHVWVEPGLKSALTEWADAEDRTWSAHCARILRQAVAERDAGPDVQLGP